MLGFNAPKGGGSFSLVFKLNMRDSLGDKKRKEEEELSSPPGRGNWSLHFLPALKSDSVLSKESRRSSCQGAERNEEEEEEGGL